MFIPAIRHEEGEYSTYDTTNIWLSTNSIGTTNASNADCFTIMKNPNYFIAHNVVNKDYKGGINAFDSPKYVGNQIRYVINYNNII